MGKMFAIFFGQDLSFDDRWKNCKNHRTRTNFVPHVHSIKFSKPIPHMINEMAREHW